MHASSVQHLTTHQIASMIIAGGQDWWSAVQYITLHYRQDIEMSIIKVCRGDTRWVNETFDYGLERIQKQKAEKLMKIGNLKNYLKKICVNAAIDRYWKENRTPRCRSGADMLIRKFMASQKGIELLLKTVGLQGACVLATYIHLKENKYAYIAAKCGYASKFSAKSARQKYTRKLIEQIRMAPEKYELVLFERDLNC